MELPKVLVVDDVPENLYAMNAVLKKLKADIFKAQSGKEALSLMLRYDFAVVLLDVQMPEMDGFEVAKIMQQNHQTQNIPIIFVTAISKEREHIFQGYSSGAVDYLFKPIETDILLGKINVFMMIYQQQQLLKQNLLEKERTEKLLQQRENLFRSITSSAPVAIVLINAKGKCVYLNKYWETITGFTIEESLGDCWSQVLSHTKRETLVRQWLRSIEEAESESVLEISIYNKDRQKRSVRVRSIRILSEEGELENYLSIVEDITEQKIAEEKVKNYANDLEEAVEERTKELLATQGQLIKSEKMASLGALVAGVAHEINTPVGIGVTAASFFEKNTRELAKKYYDKKMSNRDLKEFLDKSIESSGLVLSNLERAAELVQSFKQIAVDQSIDQLSQFIVPDYIEGVLLTLRPKLKKRKHTIEIQIQEAVTLNSYPGPFSQVITNLVMNSLIHGFHVGKEKGKIMIEITLEGKMLLIRFADNGRGIPKENLDKIFDPFFTTRRGEGGTGLGLNLVYNIITQKLKGSISCESQLNQGTTFIIRIPVDLS